MLTKEEISGWFQSLQDDICHQLETADGEGKFVEDQWERAEGGGGRSRAISGTHIQKGGVNYSAVHGPMPEKITKGLGLDPCNFYATGVSIVLHPKNPYVPIIHMNVRYFETNTGHWWFGGGIDLTPHYINKNEARFFHESLKQACDATDLEYYPRFKKWADDYFYLKHRKETRGIGGIFYDRLGDREGKSKEELFEFTKRVGQAFCPVYIHLLHQNKEKPFSEKELDWQALRRSRYVEFNLVWDRGTKFGLDTDGRTESILMSMPPHASWKYNYQPEEGSLEEQTLQGLKKGINYLS